MNSSNKIYWSSRRNKYTGFTIIEMLVAVTILLIGITAPLIISSRGITIAIFAKNKTTATFLAEEAIEYVRNTRDSNINSILDGGTGNWDDKFGQASGNCFANGASDNGCAIDVHVADPNDYIRCAPANICDITYDADTGRFGHNTAWLPTIFNRTIRVYTDTSVPPLSQPVRGEAIRVEVTVEWTDKLVSKNIVVGTTLFSYTE